jgi:hypothetical protein
VLLQKPEANIVVMGDMNDEPENNSLHETLSAKKPGTPVQNWSTLCFPTTCRKKVRIITVATGTCSITW